jgi:hypothetical protein
MLRRLGMVALLFLLPGLARAQENAPEQLLSANTQLYLRWDGIDAHKAQYEKLALGQMLKGDTGKFIESTFNQFQDLLGTVIVQELLQGTPPEKLQKIQADANEAPKLVALLGAHGFVLGVEVKGLEPPDAQAILIFPDSGEKAAPLLATLRLLIAVGKSEVKDKKIEGRTVFMLPDSPIPVAWWIEGKHVVFTVGTNPPEAVIKNFDDKKRAHLSENPLFKKLLAFKEFETGTRAFVDLESIGKLASSRNKDFAKLITDLGLDNLKSLTLWSGFDGPVDHGLMELDLAGPRKGVLKLLDAKPFALADVPALPPDAVSWSMNNVDLKVAYDEGLAAASLVVKMISPEDLPRLEAGLKAVDDLLGINLRKDLLEALGEQVVQYSSPAEGPLFFGETVLFKVKDEKKLQAALETAIKSLGKATGADVTRKKREYHGVDLYEIHVRQQGFIFVPTYTVHKGWLALSLYPQAVQGYVLRTNGELPAWKPDDKTKEALTKLPKEFVSLSVSDPRPSLEQVLSIAPLIGGAVNSFVPDSKFDVGLLPNAHEVNRHLFPNVQVTSMKGNTLRLETRASLALPLDLGNSDVLLALQFLGRFAFSVK